jgi:hypothetical protein
MRKDIGNWLMDLGKDIIVVFVLAGLLGGVQNVAVAILIGIATASACLAMGLSLLGNTNAKKKKGAGKTKKQ